MKNVQQPWFETQRIRDDLFCITEPLYTWENRAFEVMHLPGHSSGSIGLYDAGNQQYFSSDVVYDGHLLDDLEDSVVDEYLESMERLLQLKTDEVRPGHYHSFDRRRLTELVRQYIDTRKAPLCPSEK
jgi:glyoxylase-like metal-dependent hydrolase (beta-lactamase superfamily II)